MQELHTLHALSTSLQPQFTVVLVDPQDTRNIGSVARAMGNLGFSKLAIVSEQEFNLREARIMSCWSEDIIKQAQHFKSLPDALVDFEDVIGFSSTYGKNRIAHITLPELAESYSQIGASSAIPKTALLLGSEDNGLRNEHVPHCRTLVRIPSVAENPSFNLSQAVLIVLYELLRGEMKSINSPARELAPWREYAELDNMLIRIMSETSYCSTSNPETILRSAFKRLALDRREMAMLLGLFSKILRTFGVLRKNENDS